MMREVFIVSDNIISPLGCTTEENFCQLAQSKSGIAQHTRSEMSEKPFYASILDEQQNNDLTVNTTSNIEYTKFERLLILSITKALETTDIDVSCRDTVIILSTTKGNISLLETEKNTPQLQQRMSLSTSAKLIASHFKCVNQALVVSNACISGLTALLTAKRLLQYGHYKSAIVAGADVISKFILSGFQSFQAVSDEPCKPFDAARKGITLGEAAGTIVLSSERQRSPHKIKFVSGAVSNDANHISGPSRTGEELCIAVNKSLKDAGLDANDLSFISAHGTATLYNDEMEAKAFALAKLQSVPVNSLKGYYGHTLGAAGIIESIISISSLNNELVLPTIGFQKSGVSTNINICNKVQSVRKNSFLKTASGFGGCNAALVFSKSYS
jgi:3-oxoacyl-[acyl-carrier-protein] synthase-1